MVLTHGGGTIFLRLFSESLGLGLCLLVPSEAFAINRSIKKNCCFCHKIYTLRHMRGFVFRCGPLLAAGTASASSRNPLCGVFRHVLFPQESTVLRSKQPC